jgi:integrase
LLKGLWKVFFRGFSGFEWGLLGCGEGCAFSLPAHKAALIDCFTVSCAAFKIYNLWQLFGNARSVSSMSKKKMHSAEFAYLKPPRLLKGWKWLVEWEEFVPGTTDRIRVRKTFDLNRSNFITDPVGREERAQYILQEKMKEWSDISKRKDQVANVLGSTNILEAMQVALKFKLQSDREHTRITYNSFYNIFAEWLKLQKWDGLCIAAFDRTKAKLFLDDVLLTKKNRKGNPVSNRTYNNYIINMRSLFYELKDRQYLKENPFANHKPRKEEEKLRHAFEHGDSTIIARHVYQHNRPVYLAILLISHCGMRLSELRRLRARDIDLDRGLIILGGDQTKNKDRAFITIPTSVIPTLRSFDLDKIPASYLVFGLGLKPHQKQCVGRNTISDRFREMLQALHSSGQLKSIEGYTAYSWKDTGAIAMVKSGMDIVAIQKHLRHKSLSTTQRYLQSLGVINKDVRDFSGVIFSLPGEF